MKFGPKKGAIVKYCYALKNLIKSMKFLIQEKFDYPILLSQNRQPLFSSARAPRPYFLLQKTKFLDLVLLAQRCFTRNNFLLFHIGRKFSFENLLWLASPARLEGFCSKLFSNCPQFLLRRLCYKL